MSKTIPSHVAVIMDGNARWAKLNNVTPKIGYEKGIKTLENLLKLCIKLKIKILTVYALSTENSKRKNIGLLYNLIRQYMKKFNNYKVLRNIDFRLIGNRKNIQSDILSFFEKLENKKQDKKKIIFNLAYNYGSWDELKYCFNEILFLSKQNKNNDFKINEKTIKNNLFTSNLPDPDILIRTGGKKRLSNFLLLQLKYTEIFFIDKLWPDFDKKSFTEVLKDYSKRRRTYGL